MNEAVRILHFADLHIGMENYGRLDPETGLNRRVVDFLERLDQVVDYAIEHAADLVIFAGMHSAPAIPILPISANSRNVPAACRMRTFPQYCSSGTTMSR
jgi:hypothetical protein